MRARRVGERRAENNSGGPGRAQVSAWPVAAQLIGELAQIPEVAGIHVMAPANEAALPRVIAEARRRLASVRK